jgi:hypothetical protein
VEIVVSFKVMSTGSETPIVAARVLRMNSAVDFTFLGVTENFGRFKYREVVSAGPVVYRILATGYLPHTTAAVDLLPSHPQVMREIVLVPSMNMQVGLGGAPLILRLGAMLSVSAQPNSFIDVDGEVYNDMVTFRGGVTEIDDDDARAAIPEGTFEYRDPTTGEIRRFDMFVGVFLDFVDQSGQSLRNPSGLRLTVSLLVGEIDLNVMLMTYDPFLGMWNKTSELNAVESFKKRQVDTRPVAYAGPGMESYCSIWVSG